MYEDMTKNVIREAILTHTGADISKIEGSFAADMAAAVSVEMAKIYATIDYAMQTFLLQTNEGEYLDLRAAEYGIQRKPGTKATVELTAHGIDGTVIPAGTRVVSADGLVFVTDAAAEIEDGIATIPATADQPGAAYNAAPDTIAQLFKNIQGVTGITNDVAAVGGSDAETDEALRERILLRLQTPATSGNAYHYQQWARHGQGRACKPGYGGGQRGCARCCCRAYRDTAADRRGRNRCVCNSKDDHGVRYADNFSGYHIKCGKRGLVYSHEGIFPGPRV